MLPPLIVSPHPSNAIKVNRPVLFLSTFETMRRQGLCSHFSFSFSFRSVTPFVDHGSTLPVMFGTLLMQDCAATQDDGVDEGDVCALCS